MKIIHICTCFPFSENVLYQENLIAERQASDGHDVLIIANEKEIVDGKVVSSTSKKKQLKPNLRLERLPRYNFLINSITEKVQLSISLNEVLERECPDLIFYHNIYGLDLLTIGMYAKRTECILLVDIHADEKNSALTFFSKNFIHKLLLANIIKKIDKYVAKYLYVAKSSYFFAQEHYHIPHKRLRYLPLTYPRGKLSLRDKLKRNLREKYKLDQNALIFCHGGKMNEAKKTPETLKAFVSANYKKSYLILAGSFDSKIKDECFEIIAKHSNIIYMGWLDGKAFSDIIHSSDLYIQIGSQSINLQLAASHLTPSVVFPHKNYINGFSDAFFYADDKKSLQKVFSSIFSNSSILNEKEKLIESRVLKRPDLDDTINIINDEVINAG